MPPVRHKIVDSHGERSRIGGALTGDDREHLDETFEPLTNLIEREMIEFR